MAEGVVRLEPPAALAVRAAAAADLLLCW